MVWQVVLHVFLSKLWFWGHQKELLLISREREMRGTGWELHNCKLRLTGGSDIKEPEGPLHDKTWSRLYICGRVWVCQNYLKKKFSKNNHGLYAVRHIGSSCSVNESASGLRNRTSLVLALSYDVCLPSFFFTCYLSFLFKKEAAAYFSRSSAP